MELTAKEILKKYKDQVTKEITGGEYETFEVIQSFAGMLVGYHVISAIYERAAELCAKEIAEKAFDKGVYLKSVFGKKEFINSLFPESK
jgi:hypothetical protein